VNRSRDVTLKKPRRPQSRKEARRLAGLRRRRRERFTKMLEPALVILVLLALAAMWFFHPAALHDVH